ncbi:MAG: response regulator transcription factor [Elusimicrobiales bacterium]
MSEVKRKIAVVDDHPMMRSALADMIKAKTSHIFAGEACNLSQARALIKKTSPDVVILDISMPDGSGLELVRELKAMLPRTSFLVFSMHDEQTYAARALRAGASGYVMKTEPFDTVLVAIDRVLAGEIFIKEELKNDVLVSLLDSGDSSRTPDKRLSDREIEIFRAMGRGRTTREIAESFNLSVKTVQAYRERIKAKLGIANATELIQRAVQWIQESEQPDKL